MRARNKFQQITDTIEDLKDGVKKLSPFIDDDTDTPLCIAPSIIVSKTGHNIAFSLALIMTCCSMYAVTKMLTETFIEGTFTIPSIAIGTVFISGIAAGVTLFCTKKYSAEKENNQELKELQSNIMYAM
jgi:hypothetical protein